MFASDANVTVTNSVIVGSRAAIAGSFYLESNTTSIMTNVTFTDSQCTARGCIGGAIVPEGNTRLVIRSSVFQDCVAPEGFGGAIDDGTKAVWEAHDTLFLRNRATYGGAIYNFGTAKASLYRCKFINNTADNNGGAIKPSSNTVVYIEDSYFEGNVASSNAAVGPNSECQQPEGGVVYCISFLRCTFYKNYAASIAGAMALVGSTSLEDVVFDSNESLDTGGALYLYLDVPHILKNLTFINNIAPNGAAILIEGSATFTFNDTIKFIGNRAKYLSLQDSTGIGAGLAISRQAVAKFYGPVIFEDNIAGSGGGVYAAGNSIVQFEDQVTFNGNRATTNGGGLWIGGSALVEFSGPTQPVLQKNSAISYGGAIYQDAASVLITRGLSIFGNSASYGAGYAASTTVSICPILAGSSFINNTASLIGGGTYMGSTIVNCTGDVCSSSQCTLSGNRAPLGADSSATASSVSPTTNIPSSVSASEGFSASFTLLDSSKRTAASTDRVIRVEIIDWRLPDGRTKNSTTSAPAAKRDVLEAAADSTPANNENPIILRGPDVAYFISNTASFGALKLSGPPGSSVTLRFNASPAVPTAYTVRISITPCSKGYESYQKDGTYYCLKQNKVSRTTQIIITICAGICILIGLGTLIWLIVNRHRTAIRKSSVLFCILTTIGAIFIFVAAIMWVYVSDATCALRVWLLVVGFVLCYGSIFVKEYRLWLIFDETDLMRTVRVTDGLLLKVVFGGLSVELLIAMIWFIVTPFLKRIVIDLSKEEISYRCTSTVTPAFFWIMFALNMGILIIGCILAWLARNVPANFNEAKQILFAIYNVAIIAVIVVVLGSVFRTSAEAISLTVSIGLLFSSLVTLAILFVPKIRHVANKEAVRRAILKEIAQLERDIQWKKRMLQDVNTETNTMSSRAKDSGSKDSKNRSAD